MVFNEEYMSKSLTILMEEQWRALAASKAQQHISNGDSSKGAHAINYQTTSTLGEDNRYNRVQQRSKSIFSNQNSVIDQKAASKKISEASDVWVQKAIEHTNNYSETYQGIMRHWLLITRNYRDRQREDRLEDSKI